jgi:hypothetical protein
MLFFKFSSLLKIFGGIVLRWMMIEGIVSAVKREMLLYNLLNFGLLS